MNQSEELPLTQYFVKFSKRFVLLINNYYVNQPSMYQLHTFKSWTLTHEIKNPHYNGKSLPKLLVLSLSLLIPILSLMTLHVASPQKITLKFIHNFTMMRSIWIILYHSYVYPNVFTFLSWSFQFELSYTIVLFMAQWHLHRQGVTQKELTFEEMLMSL